VQLLRLQSEECKDINVNAWLEKRINKYISPEVQNECLKIMAQHVLCEISKDIASSSCFSVMADECTDCSNKEQLTVNIRWTDQDLKEHEDFIGLYQVDSITADCLLSYIQDVLFRVNLKLTNCRDQCYDGASNMSNSRNGVVKKIVEEENRALLKIEQSLKS